MDRPGKEEDRDDEVYDTHISIRKLKKIHNATHTSAQVGMPAKSEGGRDAAIGLRPKPSRNENGAVE